MTVEALSCRTSSSFDTAGHESELGCRPCVAGPVAPKELPRLCVGSKRALRGLLLELPARPAFVEIELRVPGAVAAKAALLSTDESRPAGVRLDDELPI